MERIVYLSGIVPDVADAELSEHITSRREVERILSELSATVLTLRAAVILGSGSTSFEIIRQVSERMPVHAVPTWMDSMVHPIALVDVLEALVGALDYTGPHGLRRRRTRPVRYGALGGLHLARRARSAAGRRSTVAAALVGTSVGSLTDVPRSTVEALVESLHHDMVAATRLSRMLLPQGHRSWDWTMPFGARSLRGRGARGGGPDGALAAGPGLGHGGDDRPPLAKVIDAVKDVLPGS